MRIHQLLINGSNNKQILRVLETPTNLTLCDGWKICVYPCNLLLLLLHDISDKPRDIALLLLHSLATALAMVAYASMPSISCKRRPLPRETTYGESQRGPRDHRKDDSPFMILRCEKTPKAKRTWCFTSQRHASLDRYVLYAYRQDEHALKVRDML